MSVCGYEGPSPLVHRVQYTGHCVFIYCELVITRFAFFPTRGGMTLIGEIFMLSHLLFSGIQDGVKSNNQCEVSFFSLDTHQDNNKHSETVKIIARYSRELRL